MPTLPLDPQIQGSAARLEKSRTALTKKFDPDQPRDKNGMWVHLGLEVKMPDGTTGRTTGISGPKHVSVEHREKEGRGAKEGWVTASGFDPKELEVLDTERNRAKTEEQIRYHGKPLVPTLLDRASRAQEEAEVAEEERTHRVNKLRAKVASARSGEERELAEEELEDELHPGRYKG
jgi:hypothetical protein